MIRVAAHPKGPRLYVVGRRVHHGPAFAALAAAAWGARRHRIAALCACWAATDWRDFPFRDSDNH